MQRNHPNRIFFFYLIISFPHRALFLLSFRLSRYARITSSRYLSRFLPLLYFFFLRFFILLPTLSTRLPDSALFFRGTTRPFNRVGLSLARDPSYSAIVPFLFQFLQLSYSSFPLSVSAALYSRSVLPSPTAWRVIPRKPWYFVGHGVQSHGGPDEAWPYLLHLPPPFYVPTYLSTLLCPILPHSIHLPSYSESPYVLAKDAYVGKHASYPSFDDKLKIGKPKGI